MEEIRLLEDWEKEKEAGGGYPVLRLLNESTQPALQFVKGKRPQLQEPESYCKK